MVIGGRCTLPEQSRCGPLRQAEAGPFFPPLAGFSLGGGGGGVITVV